MARFRKRPVEIEAFRLGLDPWPMWAWNMVTTNAIVFYGPYKHITHADIRTDEGVMRATRGDWIIRGVAGEVYPCRPDVFAQTYEAVAADSPPNEAPSTTLRALDLEAGAYLIWVAAGLVHLGAGGDSAASA